MQFVKDNPHNLLKLFLRDALVPLFVTTLTYCDCAYAMHSTNGLNPPRENTCVYF